MKGLLVRVGADISSGGGAWNGPIDLATGAFAYVAGPECRQVRAGLKKPYALVEPALRNFGSGVPSHLAGRHMHLDPDFSRLSYGEHGMKARQILGTLEAGDLLVFYAGLRDVGLGRPLVYALIGLYVVDEVVLAVDAVHRDPDLNAHTRRVLSPDADDLVVLGKPGRSGRFDRALPIGGYRFRGYRVRPELIAEWGGLSVRDGLLQPSGNAPELSDVDRFRAWLDRQDVRLVQDNQCAARSESALTIA